MGPTPKAVVIVFPGSNGDRDLLETFVAAGFEATYHPFDAPLPDRIDVAGLPGGFAFGDYWRAGMLASQGAAVASLQNHVDAGGLVIGICNGFQILVEAGLLPGALSYNDPPGFLHQWLTLRVCKAAPSPWFSDLAAGTELSMPMAHGEGCYFHPEGVSALDEIAPLRYGQNPNGSMGDTAALLDPTGRILGIMPHPERAADRSLGGDDGMKIFRSAYRWIEAHR